MNAIRPTTAPNSMHQWGGVRLSIQQKKVMAVALASILFFGLQFALSLPLTLAITAALITFTYINPREEIDWFNLNFERKTIACLMICYAVRLSLAFLFCRFLGLRPPQPAQEGFEKIFSKHPLKFAGLSCVVAPFTEEVLFRGFLEEKFEDMGLNRGFSILAQSFAFAAAHMNQTVQAGLRFPFFCYLTFVGMASSFLKEKNQTLVSPILNHSANNCVATLSLSL